MISRPTERASGGVVWRTIDGEVECLVAHRRAYDDWTFPKGKLESGESLIECALREVEEETSMKVWVGRFLGVTEYTKPGGQPKEVSYWAMQVRNPQFLPGLEVDQVQWVRLAELPERLSYPTDWVFAAGLPADWTDPPDRLLFTRHAHAGVRNSKNSPDSQRPLSDKGKRQAAGIVEQLRGFKIDQILTSPAVRCRQTVEPLARSRRLELIESEGLWEEADHREMDEIIRTHQQGTTLVCTHRTNLKGVQRVLSGIAEEAPIQKGATWVVDFAAGQQIFSNYLPPPAA